MRIAYCTNVRLPSERAHGHQIAQVCDALGRLGHAVTIFAPFRLNPVAADFATYYGARPEVSLRILGSFDPINRPFLPGVLGLWVLNALLRGNLRKALAAERFDLLYTRSPALLPVLLAAGVPVILELHQLPRWGRGRFVSRCARCSIVACLTSAMRETLIAWGVPASKIIVEGDAVDPARFASLPSREEARRRFGSTIGRCVVGYVGRLKTLGMEKGVGVLLQALKELQPGKTFSGFIVGGPDEDRRAYERQADALGLSGEDVLFTGEIPVRDVPTALAACDILAMPFPDLPHYRSNMSPLKMFEYMAAGRPIVTSDLPTVRDVLSEDTAVFCVPGDAHSLAQALLWIGGHSGEADGRAGKAKELVSVRYTWGERMRRILAAARLSL